MDALGVSLSCQECHVKRAPSVAMHVALSPRQKVVRSTRVSIRQRRRFHTVHCSAAAETPPLAGKRVFVAGATGGTGKYIVQRLVNDGAQVLALVRDIERGKGLLPSECELVLGDVDQLMGLPSKMESCDAVVCATGSSSPTNPLGPFKVDYTGTCNLVAAAEKAGATKFVLVSSIGADDLLFPLNLFWGVLFWKKRAEENLQRSGLDYTVVRPGGLAEKGDDRGKGNIVMNAPGHFGLPPKEGPGSIWRSAVADVCVEAITLPEASMKVVEVIAKPDAPEASMQSLFASVQ